MELLIVIGVLGILAAGLLAAIDPFEQLKKARDTNNRSATIELMQGLQRFYATHGAFPWDIDMYSAICGRDSAEPLNGLGSIYTDAVVIQDTTFETCITGSLITSGELKETFFSGIAGEIVFVGSDKASKTDLVVCFEPESKSSRADGSTKYLINANLGKYFMVEQTGVPPFNACPRQLGDCAQCFQ